MFSGFADVAYPDWTALLTRLAREARGASWTGPLVLDELPYLALSAPELPSVLQRFVDHDARQSASRSCARAGPGSWPQRGRSFVARWSWS